MSSVMCGPSDQNPGLAAAAPVVRPPLRHSRKKGAAMRIVEVTGGVDTHADNHMAAALDQNGGVLGVESLPR